MTEKEDVGFVQRKNHDADYKDSLVQSLVTGFKDAFNSHDVKTFVSLLAEDADWTDITGTTTAGRKEIEKLHVYPCQTVLKDATLDVKSFRNKWISDKIVSIEIKWESFGHRTPEGEPLPNIRMVCLTL